jgi:lauroyl/myristoyl acyltransferase
MLSLLNEKLKEAKADAERAKREKVGPPWIVFRLSLIWLYGTFPFDTTTNLIISIGMIILRISEDRWKTVSTNLIKPIVIMSRLISDD